MNEYSFTFTLNVAPALVPVKNQRDSSLLPKSIHLGLPGLVSLVIETFPAHGAEEALADGIRAGRDTES